MYDEYSANGRPLVTVEKSTQYADQVHLAQKIEFAQKVHYGFEKGITFSYHYAFTIFIVLFLSILHVMIFRVK